MRRFASAVMCIASLALAAGCATSTPPTLQGAMGDLGPAHSSRILTLGAGDSLGYAVHVNDVILAAASSERGPIVTDAQSLDQAAEVNP